MRRAILLLLAALLGAAVACPWACSCRPNAADCAHRALLHAPRRLPTDAHRLWGAALALVRERNAERILERGELPEDDVTSLLHVYCRGLAQAQPDMVAITRPVNELSQNLSFMMESLYKASVQLQRQEFV